MTLDLMCFIRLDRPGFQRPVWRPNPNLSLVTLGEMGGLYYRGTSNFELLSFELLNLEVVSRAKLQAIKAGGIGGQISIHQGYWHDRQIGRQQRLPTHQISGSL
jgi:hypothetical protein